MAIVRWNPIREMDAFQREVNRLFGDWYRAPADETLAGAWTPAVDIFEDGEAYRVNLALPGLKRDDIKVTIENNTLTVSGERKLDNEETRENYTRIEQFYGAFNRSFSLPNTIDSTKVAATMEDGVLKVVLPKREETKPKSIAVQIN